VSYGIGIKALIPKDLMIVPALAINNVKTSVEEVVMQDYISANLPAIDLNDTRQFYEFLGFQCDHQSQQWMILSKDSLIIEFFHHPQLNPKESWFSVCLRTKIMHDLFHYWQNLDWTAFPDAKITEIQYLGEVDMFSIMDPNGSLIRCIQLDS